MKLIRQVALAFQAGTSDKVYEVDLCEIGINKFVVNFRYGRRGSALRDGTKTPAPVSFVEAERIYQRLVDSKTGEGYQVTSSGAPASEPTSAKTAEPKAEPEKRKTPAGGLPPRDARVLASLSVTPPGEANFDRASGASEEGERAGRPKADQARIDRAIWRAGELKLRAALPRLIELASLATSGALRDACLAFAIARCAKPGDAAALAALQAIRDRSSKLSKSTEEVSRRAAAAGRFALEGQWAVGDGTTRKTLENAALASMPPHLATLVKSGPTDALIRELDAHLPAKQANRDWQGKTDPTRTAILEGLYHCEGEHARAALLRELREIPVAAPFFVRLRHLFKAAEIRRDAEVWGLISHRFETARSTIGNVWGWNRQQLARPDTNLAFSRGTRVYFRRRTWRLLRRLGKAGDSEFVDMAVGALLAFTDADAQPPRKSQWGGKTNWGPWAPYWAFNFLLFGRSTRFAPDEKSGKTFRCTSSWKPGDPAPAAREEIFPKLWERNPGGLLHLLDESRCEEVHRFAVKVLRDLPKFTDGFDESVHAMLFRGPYEVTAAFALILVRKAYGGKEYPAEVVEAMADCGHAPARTEAFQQIEARRTSYLAKVELMTALVTSRHADTREFARKLLRTSTMQADAVKALVAKVLAWLQAAPDGEAARAADIVETLARCFPRELQTLGLDVVADLLSRPLLALQMLGAEILLARQAAGQSISGGALQRLIESEHAQVRSLGVTLLGNLGDAFLLEQADLIAALVTHPLADLRESIRPVIVRLSRGNGAFAARMGTALVDTLLRKSLPEGMHEHVLRILRDDLQEFLTALPKETVWKLLRSKIAQAQELGGLLLPSNVKEGELSVREIVLLGSHDILSVREASWKLFDREIARVKKELRTAVAMLDAKWADTRKFAADSFRTKLSDDELTPEILVAVCDSILPEVQAVGKELITARFKAEHGAEYLLKLSEHPAESLQLFASAWLEEHAAGDVAKLEKLEPFLVSVLSRVNKGRVAKARVFAFLAGEGRKSDAAARLVARVLTRQSVTVAIGDKSASIEGMLGVADAFPGVELPIKRISVEARKR